MNDKLKYIEELESQINEAKQHLSHLKAEKESLLITSQHEEIENLEVYLEQAQIGLHDIIDAASETWSELKEILDKKMHDITELIQKLRSGK